MNRIAVISGGGADGAVTAGRLAVLKPNYKKVYGISTGALLSVHTALGNWQKLEDIFTNIEQKDITEDSAFTKNGHLSISNLILKLTKDIFSKTTTLGESKNLKKLIDRSISIDEYEELKLRNKEVKIGCFSQTFDELVYFSSKFTELEDFKEWLWASACPPVVFSQLNKKRYGSGDYEQWCDGGIGAIIPIMQAVKDAENGDVIDVFLHHPRKKSYPKNKIQNIPHNVLRSFKSIVKSRIDSELSNGLNFAEAKGVSVNVFWMEYEINSNSLVFNKEEMKTRFNLGKIWALNEKLIDRYDYK
jgi:predicted acylesterase/phospholipase RssA